MKAIDNFIGIATTLYVIAWFFLPSNIQMIALCVLFIAVGLFAIIFPQGILGWAKTARPEIDPEDESLWWVPRGIGIGFIVMSLLIAMQRRSG